MVAAALLSVGVSPKLRAANLYWDSDGAAANLATDGGGNWSTQNFFNPLTPLAADTTPGTTDIAYFGYNTGAGGTVNVAGPITIGGLVFGPTLGSNSTAGYTLTGQTSGQVLTIGVSGISLNAGGLATVVGSTNLSLALSTAQSWINNTSNPLTINGAIANGTNLLTLQALGSGNISLLGNITGTTTGGLIINSTGSGRVIISGTNTQSGTTTLTAGILRATTTSALGTGTLQLNGGVLQLIGGQTYGFGATTLGP